MEGLRNFFSVDNHCAQEVRHLKEGTRSFEVRRPKFEEACPEVPIKEGPEELTSRTEDVGSKKACINVDHIAEDRWGPSLVDADWKDDFYDPERKDNERAQAWLQRCGKSLCGKGFGPIWIRGTVCVCAQHPRIGTLQGSMGRMVSSSSSSF